ncbi:LEA type 2 family protein [Anaeromyxobacter oryzisoli]|uniref:LEA type 2 family protein n=1 Tax=Anaeromyxobacter oryzisoli TaxID=2925408 RepID=UPI001F56A611|nr:LEA type 2 family protein [Anaeromyxobacter sp. SG63]
MRPLRTAALAGLVATAAACGGARTVPPPPPPAIAIDPPVLRAEALLPQAIDAYGVTFALTGRIENPNPRSLQVARFTYAFEVLGARVGAGQVSSDLVLPASGAVPVMVPVRLRWTDVPGFLGVLATQRSLPLTARGTARVRVPGGQLDLPYALDGSVVLPRLPAVALRGAVVRESNLFQTVVEVRVDVTNPNPFPLPTGQLAYDVSLNGVSVAEASKQSLEAVPPEGTTTIVLPIRFSTVGAAAGALSGAMRGKTEVALTGRAGYGALEMVLDTHAELVSR